MKTLNSGFTMEGVSVPSFDVWKLMLFIWFSSRVSSVLLQSVPVRAWAFLEEVVNLHSDSGVVEAVKNSLLVPFISDERSHFLDNHEIDGLVDRGAKRLGKEKYTAKIGYR